MADWKNRNLLFILHSGKTFGFLTTCSACEYCFIPWIQKTIFLPSSHSVVLHFKWSLPVAPWQKPFSNLNWEDISHILIAMSAYSSVCLYIPSDSLQRLLERFQRKQWDDFPSVDEVPPSSCILTCLSIMQSKSVGLLAMVHFRLW